MNEELPSDLSPLDPTQPPLAFARRVARVRAAATGILLRRRNGSPLAMVAHWRAPLLAALIVLTLISAALLRTVSSESGLDAIGTDEVADALGVGAVLGDGSDTPSTPADILLGGYEQ